MSLTRTGQDRLSLKLFCSTDLCCVCAVIAVTWSEEKRVSLFSNAQTIEFAFSLLVQRSPNFFESLRLPCRYHLSQLVTILHHNRKLKAMTTHFAIEHLRCRPSIEFLRRRLSSLGSRWTQYSRVEPTKKRFSCKDFILFSQLLFFLIQTFQQAKHCRTFFLNTL